MKVSFSSFQALTLQQLSVHCIESALLYNYLHCWVTNCVGTLFVIGRMTLIALLSNCGKGKISCKVRGRPGHQLGTFKGIFYTDRGDVSVCCHSQTYVASVLLKCSDSTSSCWICSADRRRCSCRFIHISTPASCWQFFMFLPPNYQLYKLDITLLCWCIKAGSGIEHMSVH